MLTVLLCTDGSELANSALAEGLAVIGQPDRVVLATAIASSVSIPMGGSGRISASAEGDQEVLDAEAAAARRHLDEAAHALGLTNAEHTVLTGSAGEAICALADSLPASVIVLGTRGNGGVRRAVLGSVSDHVVRNASCPVVITRPSED